MCRKERKLEVYVVVDSETHTRASLEAMLPMTPDEAWEKGEPFQSSTGREKHRRFSRWAVIERDGDIEDWRTTVERLIIRLRPIEASFRKLPAEAYVGMMMFVTEDNGVFDFGLDKHQIEFITSIGAELDMSFVVWSDTALASANGD